MNYLIYTAAGFAAIAVPLFFGYSALHGIALGLFILLLAALYQIDALGAVVSELKRDMQDMNDELEAVKYRGIDGEIFSDLR